MHSRWPCPPASPYSLTPRRAARRPLPKPAPAAPITPAAGRPRFADLADRLLPTVVNIATTQTLKPVGGAQGLPNIPPGSPLADLFKDFLGGGRNLPRHVTSLGSGFIIDPSGFIVTNNHVVAEGGAVADQIPSLNDTNAAGCFDRRDEKTELLAVNPPAAALAKFADSDTARIGNWDRDRQSIRAWPDGTLVVVSARNRDIESGPMTTSFRPPP